MHRVLPLCFFAVILTTGCEPGEGSSPETKPPVAEDRRGRDIADAYRHSWATYVGVHPQALKRMLDDDPKHGWVKLYNRQYLEAVEAFKVKNTPANHLGAARSLIAEAEFLMAAYELALVIQQRYIHLWEENAHRLQRSPMFTLYGGIIWLRTGNFEKAATTLKESCADPAVIQAGLRPACSVWYAEALLGLDNKKGADAALAAIKDRKAPLFYWMQRSIKAEADLGSLPEPSGIYAALARRAKIRTLVASNDPDGALMTLGELDPSLPDFEEQVVIGQETVTRRYQDPVIFKTMATLRATMALKILGESSGAAVSLRRLAQKMVEPQADSPDSGTPRAVSESIDDTSLPLYLFSRFPTPEDLLTGEMSDNGGINARYRAELGEISATSVGGEDMREAVVVAEKFYDEALKDITAAGNDEGVSVVRDLKILEADRRMLVRSRARQYMEKNRWLDALFLVEHAMEKERADGAELSYINDPILFLDITRTYCQLERYREAMNPLYRVVRTRAELWALHDSLGNLSVLRTVDDQGEGHPEN